MGILVASVQFQITRLKRYRSDIQSEPIEWKHSKAAKTFIYSLSKISARLNPLLKVNKLAQLAMVARQIELISADGELSDINLAAIEVQRQVKEHSSLEGVTLCTRELSRLCDLAFGEVSGKKRAINERGIGDFSQLNIHS